MLRCCHTAAHSRRSRRAIVGLMPQLRPVASAPRTQHATVRVAALAGRQWGVVTRARPRTLERTWHNNLPVTRVARTLLDLASSVSFWHLRRALAEAEFRRLTTVDEIRAVLGRGHPGSAKLRRALEHHQPQLARTRSELERRFIALCETHAVPIPAMNVMVGGYMVDALWQHARVIVELDGHTAHATPAAAEDDRRRDLTLRSAGYTVLRYTWRQVTREPELVAADLAAALTR